MKLVGKILPLLLFISLTEVSAVWAQVFQDTTLNFGNPNDLILKSRSGTKGISIADYNQDGYLDIYFVVKEEPTEADASSWNRLFQYDGQTYHDKTEMGGSGIKGFSDFTNSQYNYKIGASWGDYNNDGFPDLFLASSGEDILLRNNGDGTFTDVTSTAGVAGKVTQLTAQGLWFDYDRDGDLDLYVSVQNILTNDDPRQPDPDPGQTSNRMYENVGDDIFKKVSEESGLNDKGLTWTSLAIDVNNDGHLDVYVANDFGHNKLYINNRDKTFTEQTHAYGLIDSANGMGLATGDPNRDGLFDIYLTNITELDDSPANHNRLFIKTSEQTFEQKEFAKNVSEAGWGWGTDFFDFDNDGDEDLVVANGDVETGPQLNRLFRNNSSDSSYTFEAFTDSSGFTIESQSFVNAIFDQDNDGFLDVLSSNTYMKPRFYLNTNQQGNWIKIWLEGVETNRNGFGSVVKVEADSNQYYRYYHGAGLFTQDVVPVHFGLGDHQIIDKISVEWLNGHVDKIELVQVNQTIRIKEFEGLVDTNSSNLDTTSVRNESPASPDQIKLIGNYPNPFNGSTQIAFTLSGSAKINLHIYNSIGQLVYSSQKKFAGGTHRFTWKPGQLNSGVYLYRLTDQKGITKTSTMLYLK